ncbi:Histone H2A protein [Dioscorea alata]|uniref:Histone H2A protein n=1 Tax=Dioscorea alata TaxID=55571 RepID=A0ACB7VQI5_DIOAL|nr:Histone H2A protein [Dioscorea alata]
MDWQVGLSNDQAVREQLELAEIRSSSHEKPKGTRSRSKRAGLEFPISKVEQYLKVGRYAKHIGASASVYLTAVLEYIVVEVLELAGGTAKDFKSKQILPRHIQLVIKHDKELSKLLKSVIIVEGGVLPKIHPNLFSEKQMTAEVDDACSSS